MRLKLYELKGFNKLKSYRFFSRFFSSSKVTVSHSTVWFNIAVRHRTYDYTEHTVVQHSCDGNDATWGSDVL